MLTSLPNLPFPHMGIYVDPFGSKSCPRASPQPYPRTDLTTLKPWSSFANDVEKVIRTAMESRDLHPGTELTVGNLFGQPSVVAGEEALRGHANGELHPAVAGVVAKLGIGGYFGLPCSGNVALVGEPDFYWVQGGTRMHSKLVVKYKPDWVADLKDLLAFFTKPRTNRNTNEKQSVKAIEQLYGYMTFNQNKYGILSNWTRAWFMRRVETDDRKILECAGPIELDGSDGSMSMLKAFVGMVLFAERDWFCASPTLDPPPPGRFFGSTEIALQVQKKALAKAGNYAVKPHCGAYRCLELDFRLCDFELSSARHTASAVVVRTNLLQDASQKPPLAVVCKVIDAIHNPKAFHALEAEARAYAVLQHLQGKVVPKLHGYYQVWGILHILALEHVGEAIPEDEVIVPAFREKMKSALACIHSAGYVHGDIARRNFCVSNGRVFIVDLETLRASNESERQAEEQLIDSL